MVSFPSNNYFSFTETCPFPYPEYEADVVVVLDSVKLLFSKYFDNIDAHPLSVKNLLHDDYPMTVYESNTIFLNVNPVDENNHPRRDWCKLIYQFSHEFCHYMNYGHVVQPLRWFEETLCELASHFFLLKSVEQWAVSPPYTSWRYFSSCLLDYELASRTEIIPFDFEKDFPNILKHLEAHEYEREYNRFIAITLLPLFVEKPSLWKIVPHLTSLPSSAFFLQNLIFLGQLSGEDVSGIIYTFYPLYK